MAASFMRLCGLSDMTGVVHEIFITHLFHYLIRGYFHPDQQYAS